MYQRRRLLREDTSAPRTPSYDHRAYERHQFLLSELASSTFVKQFQPQALASLLHSTLEDIQYAHRKMCPITAKCDDPTILADNGRSAVTETPHTATSGRYTLLPRQEPILDARQIIAFNNDHGLKNLNSGARKISASLWTLQNTIKDHDVVARGWQIVLDNQFQHSPQSPWPTPTAVSAVITETVAANILVML